MILGGDELAATRTATTVRLRDGQTQVTDGPYAETKEALGGYYLLECASMDEALDWAARSRGCTTAPSRYGRCTPRTTPKRRPPPVARGVAS